MRRNPFEELERMFERMSDQFEGLEGFDPGRLSGSILVDVEDRDEGYVVTADLPGFDREDIEVSVRDDALELSAMRESDEETSGGTFVRRERRRSDVRRSIRLPEPVVADETTAAFENGVLTVTLPKETVDEGEGTDIPVN